MEANNNEPTTNPNPDSQAPNADGAQPPVQETPPSGLPSDQPQVETYEGFNLTEETKALFKDGKLNGRFGSLSDVLSKLKEAEDFKSATMSEQAKAAKGNTQQQQADDAKTAQNQVINSLIPEFIGNGMVLTPEMEAKAVEAKIDIRDLKIGAMEMRDATAKAHGIVGSKEEYDGMIAWGRTVMSTEQMRSFDKDISGSMGEYAIKGLHSEFQKAKAEGTVDTTTRIEGSHTTTGLRGYANRQELYADKNVAEQNKRRGDSTAWNKYQQKLKLTPNSVLGI